VNVIDFHVHPGESLYGQKLPVDELLARMDRLQISRAVLVAPKPRDYVFGPANERIQELVLQHEDRFAAFCRVDPWQRYAAVAEAQSCLFDHGMAGIFLHPMEENFAVNLPIVDEIVSVASDAEVPVMIAGGHARVSMAPQVADLVRRWPKVKFVITSGGQINVSGVALADARRMFLDCPNTWLETSGIYRVDFIEDMAAEIGAARIVFGSDSPHYDQELESKRVLWAHRPDGEKRLMAGANAEALLARP
jgi:predicted TIM-barrel fold metal-dependent hydrolase